MRRAARLFLAFAAFLVCASTAWAQVEERLSNLHIFRLGGSFHPLETIDAFKNLEVGVFGYLYREAEKDQPISDPRSVPRDADIGT